jgi:hypothetical protein
VTQVPASSHGSAFNGGTITTPLVVAPSDPSAIPIKITPAAGATAAATDLIEIYDDAGNLIGYWDARGNVEADPAAAATNVTQAFTSKGAGRFDASTANGAELAARPASSTYMQAASGQRAEVTVSGAARVPFAVAADAVLVLVTGAPADATLAASELALWFDPTNGAAKLMIKAKQANGTVVTASIALA